MIINFKNYVKSILAQNITKYVTLLLKVASKMLQYWKTNLHCAYIVQIIFINLSWYYYEFFAKL